jgi:uncharacterized protein YndB with AHSA1/START domain
MCTCAIFTNPRTIARKTLKKIKMTTKTQQDAVIDETGHKIFITRIISAPRELVFDAWTDPQHIVHWYGPAGFTITIKDMDLRAGGTWRFTLHGPDGHDYQNKVIFEEVSRPTRLAYRHASDEETEPVSFRSVIDFVEEDNFTRLQMRMEFKTPEDLQRVVREYGAIEGAKQTLTRLEDYLATLS